MAKLDTLCAKAAAIFQKCLLLFQPVKKGRQRAAFLL
jgi:hypothetical protein